VAIVCEVIVVSVVLQPPDHRANLRSNPPIGSLVLGRPPSGPEAAAPTVRGVQIIARDGRTLDYELLTARQFCWLTGR
jgi:hypothetical protein